MNLITRILGSILGNTIPDAVATAGKYASLAVVVPSLWLWYQGHGQSEAVCFTWGQVLFVGGILYVIVQIVQSAYRKEKRGPFAD